MTPRPAPLTRRAILLGAALATSGTAQAWATTDAASELTAIEHASGGRMGVLVRDTGAGRILAHRPDERFAMCSTFKALAVGRVLNRVDHGELSLEQRIAYARRDLLETSPVTARRVSEGGLALGELCAAAIEYSDNTAANLILRQIGDPAGLTAWLRGEGDTVTRLDRRELALNSAIPGDPRDTTSPRAMAATFEKLTLGAVLKPASRDRLQAWLAANTTGGQRLRAGLPKGWAIGDKTGSNAADTANDVALIRPPGRQPLIAAVFVTRAKSQDAANTAIAQVGRFIGLWASSHG
jgi:beta-lactamase class A